MRNWAQKACIAMAMDEEVSSWPPDLYEVLRVPRLADKNDIKEAYMKLARVYHPDKRLGPAASNSGGNVDADDSFIRIQRAWEILGDDFLKAMYDVHLAHEQLRVRCSDKMDNIVPLEEFNHEDDLYFKECRCGDRFTVTESDINDGINTIQCSSCSLEVTITA